MIGNDAMGSIVILGRDLYSCHGNTSVAIGNIRLNRYLIKTAREADRRRHFCPQLLLFDVERNVCYDQSDKLICDPWNYRLPARNLAGVIKRENNGERRKYSKMIFRFSQIRDRQLLHRPSYEHSIFQ